MFQAPILHFAMQLLNEYNVNYMNIKTIELYKDELKFGPSALRLCSMTLNRLEILKPLEPNLTEVIISVSMQVLNNY